MKPYEKLTWRGRLRRLRLLALDALQAYDLDVDQVALLATDTNVLYRVTTTAGERFALRLANPRWRDREAAAAEVAWLDGLVRDTEIPVPRILRSKTGAGVVLPAAEGAPAGWHALLMSWQPGMLLSRRLHARNLAAMGELFAQLHLHGANWTPPEGFSPRKFNFYISRGEPQILFAGESTAVYKPETSRLLHEMHETVTAAYAALDPADLRVIHCDLWHDNIKLHKGQLRPFDFEDTIRGYRLHDIAMAMLDLYEDTDEERYYPLLAAFRAGYTRLLPWPEGELVHFQLGRMLWILNYVACFSPQNLAKTADFYAALFTRYKATGQLVPPLKAW